MITRRTMTQGIGGIVALAVLLPPVAYTAVPEPVAEVYRITEQGHLYVHGRLVASTHGTTGEALLQTKH